MSMLNLAGQAIVQNNISYTKGDTPKSASFHTKFYSGIKPEFEYANTPLSYRQSESCENSYSRYQQQLEQQQWRKDKNMENIPPIPLSTQSLLQQKSKYINSNPNNQSQINNLKISSISQRSFQQLLPQDKKQYGSFTPSSILASIVQKPDNLLPTNRPPSPRQHKFKMRQCVNIRGLNNMNESAITTLKSDQLLPQQGSFSATPNPPKKVLNQSIFQLNQVTPAQHRLSTSILSSDEYSMKSQQQRDAFSIISIQSARSKPMQDATNLIKNVFQQPIGQIQQRTHRFSNSQSCQSSISEFNKGELSCAQTSITPNSSIIFQQKRDTKESFYEQVADLEEDKKIYKKLVSQSPIHRSRKQTVERENDLIKLNPCQTKQDNTFSRSPSLSGQIKKKVNNSLVIEQSQSFSKNYKKISNIVDEVKHFNDQMQVSEVMLTTTINSNVLPRKLGIIQEKGKIGESFDASNSPTKASISQSFKSVLFSQSRKYDDSYFQRSNDQTYENNDTVLSGFETKSLKEIEPKNPKEFDYSYKTSASLLLTCQSSRQLPTNLQSLPQNIKRSSSVLANLRLQNNQRADNHTNGIAEKEREMGKNLVKFKDSDEVATYLQAAFLEKKQKQNLNLSRLHITKTYSTMLCQALQHPHFELLNSLNLTGNNLAGHAIEQLSLNLPKKLRKLNLSSNFLTYKDSNSLKEIFNHKKYSQLCCINLSNNSLGDVGLKSIFEQLSINSSLLSLNLAHNKLSDQVAPLLKQMLFKNSGLQELYLNWNKISSKGGVELAAGLNNNFNIKVLDLSHNCLGQNLSLRCGKKLLISCSRIESGVIHLDLSYNLFQVQECQEMATVLSSNKKLLGFHFEGNEAHATIDSMGYIYFPNDSQILQTHVATHTLMQRDICSIKCLGVNKIQNFNCNATDNCWVCDGWQEIEFELNDGCSDAFLGNPAFLHLDFEDFKPVYMDRDPYDSSRFFLRRMCPPNRRIMFFFTNPCIQILFDSSDYPRMQFHYQEQNLSYYEEDDDEEGQRGGGDNSTTNEINKQGESNQSGSTHHLQKSKQRKFSVKYLDGTVQEYIVPTTVNWIQTKLHKNIHKRKGEYDVQIKSLIRPQETFFKINYTNQWHRGISLFKSFQADTAEVELKCFDEDWNSTKIPALLQNADKNFDLSTCKSLLLQKFPQIRVIYRYLSCFGVINDMFCMNLHSFSLFATQSKIVDGTLLKMRDLECIFIAASSKALKPKSYRLPDKALTRSEFLEAVARLALDKYIRNKLAKTASEAISMLISSPDFIAHTADFEDPQKWRNIRYWTKGCDGVLKRYLNFIKSLWNEYADSRKIEKKAQSSQINKTMSLNEFQDLINEFQIKDKLLGEREVNMSFNLSLMTVIDETTSDKFMLMIFVEFLESLARLAEFKSVTPLGEREEAYKTGEREEVALEYKLESMLEEMSRKYDQVIKQKKKEKIFQQNLSLSSLNKRSNQKLQVLKSRKSYIQFSSVTEKNEDEELNNTSNLNQIPKNKAIPAYEQGMHSNTDLSKRPSRFLDRIDSLNDELEEEIPFQLSTAEKVSKEQQIFSLQEIEDN